MAFNGGQQFHGSAHGSGYHPYNVGATHSAGPSIGQVAGPSLTQPAANPFQIPGATPLAPPSMNVPFPTEGPFSRHGSAEQSGARSSFFFDWDEPLTPKSTRTLPRSASPRGRRGSARSD